MKLVTLLLVFLAFPASANQASKAQCQSWHKKSDYYQTLRKNGGSGSQMDNWKRKRRTYDDKIKGGNCRKYGTAGSRYK